MGVTVDLPLDLSAAGVYASGTGGLALAPPELSVRVLAAGLVKNVTEPVVAELVLASAAQ